MKSFITPDISANGQKIFRLQSENIDTKNILRHVQDLNIIAYLMPAEHSFQSAWIFRLIFNNGISLEFSSVCTMVNDWQEIGTLNIRLIDDTNSQESDIDQVLIKTEIPPFKVVSLIKLIYEDKEFCSDCGIVIIDQNEQEIVIATGISPGSVSILAPFSTSTFEPEFPVSECKRKSL